MDSDTPPIHTESRSRFTVRSALRSDVGLVRSENQDFATLTSSAELSPEEGYLFIVADGMGGHRGGATASKLAASSIKESFLAHRGEDTSEALRGALEEANEKVFSESKSNLELRGMGTTCSALAILPDRTGWIAHVGDSRIYRIRQGEITQLTDDHSLVATMVREGLLTTQEAEHHPRRNVLQRSLGVANEVEVDTSGPLPLELGDVFILCTDGLHGLVKPEELSELARLPVETAANQALSRALERGAPDNVTLIIVRIGDDPPPESEIKTAKMEAGAVSEATPVTVSSEVSPGGAAFRWVWIGLLAVAAGAAVYWWR